MLKKKEEAVQSDTAEAVKKETAKKPFSLFPEAGKYREGGGVRQSIFVPASQIAGSIPAGIAADLEVFNDVVGINFGIEGGRFGVERTDVPFGFPKEGIRIGDTVLKESDLIAILKLAKDLK